MGTWRWAYSGESGDQPVKRSDGRRGATTEDLKAASDALADATEKLAEALDSDQIGASERDGRSDGKRSGDHDADRGHGIGTSKWIGTPVANIGAALTQLQTELSTLQTSMNAIMGQCIARRP